MTTSLAEMVMGRWNDLPTNLKSAFEDPSFYSHIGNISKSAGLTPNQQQTLVDEILLVLFLFEPISALKSNIVKRLAIAESAAEAIISEIELLILYGSIPTLKTAESDPLFVSVRGQMQGGAVTNASSVPLPEINPDTREKLELRPQGVPHMPAAAPVEDPGARPLTREEVLRTLAPKRTLASDIESLRQQGAAAEGYTPPQQTEDTE
jgi:hypothetical protein